MKKISTLLICTAILLQIATAQTCVKGNCQNGFGTLKQDSIFTTSNFKNKKIEGFYYQQTASLKTKKKCSQIGYKINGTQQGAFLGYNVETKETWISLFENGIQIKNIAQDVNKTYTTISKRKKQNSFEVNFKDNEPIQIFLSIEDDKSVVKMNMLTNGSSYIIFTSGTNNTDTVVAFNATNNSYVIAPTTDKDGTKFTSEADKTNYEIIEKLISQNVPRDDKDLTLAGTENFTNEANFIEQFNLKNKEFEVLLMKYATFSINAIKQYKKTLQLK
jgi:hypothetical protein